MIFTAQGLSGARNRLRGAGAGLAARPLTLSRFPAPGPSNTMTGGGIFLDSLKQTGLFPDNEA